MPRKYSTAHAIGKVMQELRGSKKLSQVDLAKKSGIVRDYISKLERGEKPNPTINTLFKLAKGFDISAAELINKIEAISRIILFPIIFYSFS